LLESILQEPTNPRWVEGVLDNLNLFVLDHAACERKASAMAMSFVVKYPDRKDVVDHMVSLSIEELKHFLEVFQIIKNRGLNLPKKDEADIYVNHILSSLRHGRDDRFLDRLVMSAVIEARGHERFMILSENLEDQDLRMFYARLSKEESGHCTIFLRLAKNYFSEEIVNEALKRIVSLESEAILKTPLTYRLH